MKVVFFSPFANVWEDSFPEALVGEAFAQESMDVVVVRCDGMFHEYCVSMAAAGLGPDAPLSTRLQVCKACTKRRDLLTDKMHLPAIIMDQWLDLDTQQRINSIISGVTKQNWVSLEVEGVALGRYAAYELWLNNKLVSTELSDDLWFVYLGQLRNTLMTYFAAERIIAAEKPDRVIVYNDHYSVNHAFTAAAQKAGVASYTIHGGSHISRRGETLSIFESDYSMEDVFGSESWRAFSEAPIGQAEVDLVGGHMSGLLAANSAFAYSSQFVGTSATELRKRFGINPGAKVLLATMSSEDELMALRLIDAIPPEIDQSSLFSDQFEWVDYLFEYARAHPGIHIVLRLHPRMFPNKRESVLSPVVGAIVALRDDAPANVSFNMPADGVGLYDLMQVVDVLLNFRSSVGAELSAVGIPVVVPSNSDFFTYPSKINRIGSTLDGYAAEIDRALAEGWSLENSRRSFRWYAYLFGRVAVDFSHAVNSQPIAARPKKPGFRLWLWRRFVFVFLQYGPMVRERLAMRRRALAPTSRAIFSDVIQNGLASASDSTLWPASDSSLSAETAMLGAYLERLTTTLWAGITEPDSLAGRIRTSLGVDQAGSLSAQVRGSR